MEKVKSTLTEIPETMLTTLWAKAVESDRPNPLLRDEKAKEIIGPIDYDFSKFKKAKFSQLGCCIRAKLIDNEARQFLAQHPDLAFVFIEKIPRGEYDAKLAKGSIGLPADKNNTSWPVQLADVKPYLDNMQEIFPGAETNPEITPALKENLMKLYAGQITGETFVGNMKVAAGN